MTAVLSLLLHHADVNARDKDLSSALHHVCDTDALTDPTLFRCSLCVRELLAAGAKINAQDSEGKTPLAIAVFEENQSSLTGEFPIIQTLLEFGCDVNLGDKQGSTPLMQASRFCLPIVVRILLDAGADPTLADHEGRTAMQYAEERTNSASLNDSGDEIADMCRQRAGIMASLALASQQI